MHGRIKTRTTEEQREIAILEKRKKAKSYQDAMKIIFLKRSSSCYDQEALDVMANLLTGNPDIITLWNYRREILLHLKTEYNVENYQKLLEKDLYLTEQCLRVNPKSYGSWHHRVWILDNLPYPNWERELILCTKYLQLDERNFHCWDYRRTVTQKSNISDISEYNYTLKKIEANFSNYSAWHLRSKLLPKIFPDSEKKFPIDEAKHREELELVENAAFTDPNDQSAWFYQRWLLGLTEPNVSFTFLEAGEEDLLVVTSKSVKLNGSSKLGVTVRVEINGKNSEGIWSSNSQSHSCVWSFKPKTKIQLNDSIYLILEENGVEYNRQQLQPLSSVTNSPNFFSPFSHSLMETLTNQLSSCKQLLELEPDSKWTLLTSVFLMFFINREKYHDQIISGFHKLCKIDPLREGYYLDQQSKILIESAILKHFGKNKKFLMTNKGLTCFYYSQYLCEYEVIDLSCNSLKSESLRNFKFFLKCKSLNLSNNQIKSLKQLPVLPKLENLVLDDNLIEEVNWEHFEKFYCLKKLSISNNPVVAKKLENDEIVKRIRTLTIISGC